jgi:DNA-binding transcriptional ArsR family regulator
MSSTNKEGVVYKALADPKRRKILDLLKGERRTTGYLCNQFKKKLDRCTVMQHLRVLERAELVIVKREGRLRWNYLNVVPIRKIYNRWISQYASPSVELLTRLQSDLESTLQNHA